ncbi:MAG: hypothetical protein AUI93_05100 [Crenarchaeota archaeon 13_1_40CM_3_52_10]|nr:MAG: hypothetical protein AUI93_05100 [Crenarchaeota archaeon 13_1_40CM_3_52_10]
MRSIGTRIGLWVLGLPAFGIFSLLVALYSYGGPSFVTPVIPWAISGTGALVFLWQGMKSSATKKLDFLNEYAFSPLRNMVAIDEPARARNSLAARKTGEILEILKSNGKYLLFRFYPKKLLSQGKILTDHAEEFLTLWDLLYNEAHRVVPKDKELERLFGGTVDFGVIIYRAGIDNRYNDAYFSSEKKGGADTFLGKFKADNPGKLERLVALNGTLLGEAASIAKLLDEFMRANLLGLLSPSQF